MPSPSQDTVACTCPSCGNLFAVKASFLGRQVRCPICTASVTARPEEKTRPETEEQDAVPCLCHVCGNPFAVRAARVGSRVKCPVCHSAVTAVKREEAHSTFPARMPEAAKKNPGLRGSRLFRRLPPGFRILPRTPRHGHRLHQRKRRTNGPFPSTLLPFPAPPDPPQKSANGKRKTPLRPSPRHAAPPWPRKSRNTGPPPWTSCAANAGPPGISGFLSQDSFFSFWAYSCSCAGGIWKRKAPKS